MCAATFSLFLLQFSYLVTMARLLVLLKFQINWNFSSLIFCEYNLLFVSKSGELYRHTIILLL